MSTLPDPHEQVIKDIMDMPPWERTNRIPLKGQHYPDHDTWEERRDLAAILNRVMGKRYSEMRDAPMESLRVLVQGLLAEEVVLTEADVGKRFVTRGGWQCKICRCYTLSGSLTFLAQHETNEIVQTRTHGANGMVGAIPKCHDIVGRPLGLDPSRWDEIV